MTKAAAEAAAAASSSLAVTACSIQSYQLVLYPRGLVFFPQYLQPYNLNGISWVSFAFLFILLLFLLFACAAAVVDIAVVAATMSFVVGAVVAILFVSLFRFFPLISSHNILPRSEPQTMRNALTQNRSRQLNTIKHDRYGHFGSKQRHPNTHAHSPLQTCTHTRTQKKSIQKCLNCLAKFYSTTLIGYFFRWNERIGDAFSTLV